MVARSPEAQAIGRLRRNEEVRATSVAASGTAETAIQSARTGFMFPTISRRTLAFTSLTLSSVVSGPRLGAQTSAAASRTPDFAAVDAYVAREMSADRLPGVSIAIVHGDSIVHVHGFGDDGHGRPVTAETGFLLGSMSKAFTALAIMQLVDRGAVMLDAPVKRYLPAFRVADAKSSEKITVRQLLYHTSGIPTYAPRAHGTALTVGDHVRALSNVELAHAPGTVHEYASPNYLVLGAIIEAVTGQTYATYVHQSVFLPLSMRGSFTDQTMATANSMARGHRYIFGYPVAATLPEESDRLPTAALISNAQDLAHFLIAQLGQGQYAGQRVLSPAAVELMHRGGARADGFSYAFGWRDGTLAGVRAVHHGGILPHFRGKMVMLPELGWGVVVLTNASSSLPLPLAPTSHRMADGIAAYLAGQSLPPASSRHRVTFAALTFAMIAVIVAQLRGLWRAHRRPAPAASSRRAAFWRQSVVDLAYVLLAVVGPSLLHMSWKELLQLAPDVSVWLLTTVILSLATVVARWARWFGAAASAATVGPSLERERPA